MNKNKLSTLIIIISMILFPHKAYSFLGPIARAIKEGLEGLSGLGSKTPSIVGETDQVLKKVPLEELNQSDKIMYLDDSAFGNIRNNDPIIIPDSEGAQIAKESENIPSQNQKDYSEKIIDSSKQMALPASGGVVYGLKSNDNEKKEKIKKEDQKK